MLKSFFRQIPSSIHFLNRCFIFGIIFFIFFRFLFFEIYKPNDEQEISLVLKSFFFGLRFDNALLCYSFFLPLVLLFANELSGFKLNFLKSFSVFFIGFVFLIYQFIFAADIPYYKQFGNHLNKNALLWKNNASFVLGFIFENFSYWGFLLVFIFTATVTIFLIKKINQKLSAHIKMQVRLNRASLTLWFILYVGFLILGARGTLSQKTTMHEGFAIISSNPFINNVCLNPNYSFLKSLIKSKDELDYEVPKNIDESLTFTRQYLNIKTPFQKTIDRKDSSFVTNKPNVVLVIMESMSIAKMGYYNYSNLTPNLHALNKESVFFNQFFSSGIHTFNGLFSITTGFPSIYSEHSLNKYTKTHFDGLGTLLKKEGYSTYFGTTHDSQFDNMEGFFRLNNFETIINQSSMPSTKVISTLGVPDHVLFDELISTINIRKSTNPFLSVLMTSTDHGPWIYPTDISFKPDSKNEQERCTQYADWAIGQFMNKVKKQKWYNNTVFLFVADHGMSNGPYEMPLSFNHVPFIIHQPSMYKADTISSPCYQPDVVATIMGIIGAPYINKTFGINVLKNKHPFVVFSADDKLALVDSNGYYFYHTLSNNQVYLRKYKLLDTTNYVLKMPFKADSMRQSMMHIFNSAHYLIREKYYN